MKWSCSRSFLSVFVITTVVYCTGTEAQSPKPKFLYRFGAASYPPFPTPGSYTEQNAPPSCGTGGSYHVVVPLPCKKTYLTKLAQDGKIIYTAWITNHFNGTLAGVVEDSEGNAIVAGSSEDPLLPVSPEFPIQPGNGFLAKLSADGSKLLWAIRFGGSGMTTPSSILRNSVGDLWVSGVSTSEDFPAVRPLQRRLNAAANCSPPGFPSTPCPTGFVLKIDAAGTKFLFSSNLGGSFYDTVTAMALDSSDAVYLTGRRLSADFPFTPSAYSSSTGGIFVAKLRSDGSGFEYSTALGGSTTFNAKEDPGLVRGPGDETAAAISVDRSGNAVVAGITRFSSFGRSIGTTVASPTVCGTLLFLGPKTKPCANAFLARMNSKGDGLISASVLNASGESSVQSLSLDSSDNAFIAGSTTATDFPVSANAFQVCNAGTFFSGFSSSFLALAAPEGNLLYSSYSGGFGDVGSVGFVPLDNGQIAAQVQFVDEGTQSIQIVPNASSSVPARPTFVKRCIGNAAERRPDARYVPSGIAQVIAPGEILTILGRSLGPQIGVAGPGGVEVTFDGWAAPILYSQANQINLIVPKELQQGTSVVVMLKSIQNGVSQMADPVTIAIDSALPSIFTVSGSGAGQAVALNEDGNVNSPDYPAVRGSIVKLFATGFTVDPSLDNGQIALVNGPDVHDPSSKGISIDAGDYLGGITDILYAGQAGGYVQGVQRIEFRLPDNASTGPSVRVQVNGYHSFLNTPVISVR